MSPADSALQHRELERQARELRAGDRDSLLAAIVEWRDDGLGALGARLLANPTLGIDWFRVFADMKRCGVSVRAVARNLKDAGVCRGRSLDESKLRYYANGGQPRDGVAVALLRHWSATTGRAIGEVPLHVPLHVP